MHHKPDQEVPPKHRHLIINLARAQRGHEIPRPSHDARRRDQEIHEVELGDQLGAFA